MKNLHFFLAVAFLLFFSAAPAQAQLDKAPHPAGEPPKMLLLVHREVKSGKEAERQKLEAAMSRACDHLKVPNSWIDLESLTGFPEALSFDPFDSFAHVDIAFAEWRRIFAKHPGIAHLQEQIKALVSSERTIIAVRRDDLGYRALSIDLSKARFLRVLEVRLLPGHERDFDESFKMLGEAYEKIKANTPWVVYQVNVGMPSPTFLVFVPMRALQQNDDLLSWRRALREAEGGEASARMEHVAREAYQSTESNLYFISPETSHVSKEFAEGEPEFWSHKALAAPKPAPPKDGDSNKNP
jgi:hypothetical protein